jgi:hypothetical protein
MLERKLLKFQLDDLKMRTLLELLTDEDWDDYQFKDEDEEIRKLAQDALMRRLGLSDADARKLVGERWSRHNPPEPDESTKKYLIGPTRTRTEHVATHARPTEHPMPYDVRKHMEGLGVAREHMRDQL